MNSLTTIMYHYVRDLKNSAYPNIKGLDFKLFQEQVFYLKKHYNFITMEELIDHLENSTKLPSKAVLLTFDDGYIDHYKVADFLKEENLQGSFYIPTKTIIENHVLDPNKIHFILAKESDSKKLVQQLKYDIEFYQKEYNLSSFDDYFKRLAKKGVFDSKEIIFFKHMLQYELPEKLRHKIVNKFFNNIVHEDEATFAKELYLNAQQVKSLVASGMHIGCHGYDHYWWNHITKEALEEDLNKSLNFMKKHGVNMEQWTACYPYGGYDAKSIEILENRGCKAAFTVERNVAKNLVQNRFVLPRLDTNDLPKHRDTIEHEWYNKG